MQRVYGTAFLSEKELKDHLTRIEEAKKRDHRKIGRDQKLFMFHQWAPGATFWLPNGHDPVQPARQLHARRAHPLGLHRGEGADRLQQGAVGNVRSLVALPAEHVPRRVRRRADGAQGDELPRPHAHLRQRGAQLSRPADPLSRADAAASQRGVRRAVGTDPRPAVQPGRWPLLRDGVADRR